MVAKFLDHNNRELKQDDGDGNENGKKSKRFKWGKQQLYTCITLFCTFLSHRCANATWNFLISCALFMDYVNTRQQLNFLFIFLNLHTVLSDWTPENFAIIWQIEWNWTRTMKFETVRIHFLSDVFCLFRSRKLATMATWRNDFSSLLIDYV